MISSPAYVLKTRRAETIAPEVRALVREVAPSAPMYRAYTMSGLARDSMMQLSFTLPTLGIVSALALILGVVIGVVVALAFTRALGSLLFGVKTVDAVTFIGMSASMVAIGLLASMCRRGGRREWTR